MDELISKREVLEAILGEPTDAHYPSWYADKVKALPSADLSARISKALNKEETERFRKAMKNARVGLLPSAEPEKRTNKRTETHECDLISRQVAIDAWKDDFKDFIRELLYIPRDDYKVIMEFIDDLPSAEPQERKGKWIDDGTELGCQCSECGKSLDEYINNGTEYMTLIEIPNFCPNCGSYNGGEDEA